jgi:hypothetical protein
MRIVDMRRRVGTAVAGRTVRTEAGYATTRANESAEIAYRS